MTPTITYPPPIVIAGDVHWLGKSWTPKQARNYARALIGAAAEAEEQRRNVLRRIEAAAEAEAAK